MVYLNNRAIALIHEPESVTVGEPGVLSNLAKNG